MANINIGQNAIFICSHVDSLIQEKGINIIKFVHSYKKCNNTPKRQVTEKPINCQILVESFMIHLILFVQLKFTQK